MCTLALIQTLRVRLGITMLGFNPTYKSQLDERGDSRFPYVAALSALVKDRYARGVIPTVALNCRANAL